MLRGYSFIRVISVIRGFFFEDSFLDFEAEWSEGEYNCRERHSESACYFVNLQSFDATAE